MPEDAEAEDQRRTDAPPAVCIELRLRRDSHDTHTGDAGIFASRPLSAGEKGNLVAAGGELFGEISVPPFGSADREGVEAVVDDADAHDADPSRPTGRRRPARHGREATRIR